MGIFNNEKETFYQRCVQKAMLYNGYCISKEFVSSREKLQWKCSNDNHPVWTDYYTNVVNGMKWCSLCEPFIKDKVKMAKYLAKNKGGNFLEDKYLGSEIKHRWQCSEKHIFETSYRDAISKGRWCPYCANQVTKKTKIINTGINKKSALDRITIAQNYANKKQGKCLSKEYNGSSKKLLWKCSNKKHDAFFSTYNCVINQNRWCPECGKTHIQEERVRSILNNIFKSNLTRCNPSWNINKKTEKVLELDGYDSKLGIAFEYQGTQHYKNLNGKNAFNKSDENILKQQIRDEIKKKNCFDKNITLLIINAEKHRDTYQTTMKNILKAIEQCNISLLHNPLLDFNNEIIYNTTTNHVTESRLEECHNYAKINNGLCLSLKYINSRGMLKWKCHNLEHATWERSFEGSINNKTWCPYCAIRKKRIL